MPYINKETRKYFDDLVNDLHRAIINVELDHENTNTEGNLNYIITLLLQKVYNNGTTSYENINNAIGVLECVKQEFYRRVAVPYEDVKIETNGDVDLTAGFKGSVNSDLWDSDNWETYQDYTGC